MFCLSKAAAPRLRPCVLSAPDPRLPKVESNARSAVEQAAQVILRQGIVRACAHEGCKGGGTIVGIGWGIAQRFVGAQKFRAAAKREVANGAAHESFRPRHRGRAYANAGAKNFVGRFKARGGVDRVAVGGVVEQLLAAEIADYGPGGSRLGPRRRTACGQDPGGAGRRSAHRRRRRASAAAG